MNKLNNIIIIAFIALCFVSCGEKFLEEVDTTRRTTDYFDTPDGLKAAAAVLPAALRLPSHHESCIAHFEIGTDEFSTGGDTSQDYWNSYTDLLAPYIAATTGLNQVDPGVLWDDTYMYINPENMIITKAPTVLENDPELNAILGAAYFMRAWNHFNLLQQWGDVPLMDKYIEGFTREFSYRTPKQEVLQFVIDDFQKAYDLLENPAARVQGKIYKVAAAHYLAKALLYRQSEINADFNASTKDEDLSKALALCDEVISQRQLAPNFADLHNFKRDNDPDVEQLDEILLSAQYSTQSLNGTTATNYITMFYVTLYQNWYCMVRDIGGGREYNRMRATDYSIDVFDRVNDSRFWKSFRTMQILNRIYDGQADKRYHPQLKPGSPQVNGQVGVMHIINSANDYARFQSDLRPEGNYTFPGGAITNQPLLIFMDDGTGKWDTIRCPLTGNVVPNVIPRYRTIKDDKYPDYLQGNDRYYGYLTGASGAAPSSITTSPCLSKFMDGTRPAVGTDGQGTRDFVNARVAETYLIAAEVKVRQGDYAGALTYINKIRERAAYKQGEDRSKHVDGAQAFHLNRTENPPTSYIDMCTYYISNNIPVTTASTDITINSINPLPAEDEAIIAKLGYTSDFDRMLCLILNERTRELCGEMHRWHDLARTKTLIKRTLAYNMDAIYETSKSGRGLREHHYLRPIPQRYLDAIWKDGKPLTPDEKKAMQNPGY